MRESAGHRIAWDQPWRFRRPNDGDQRGLGVLRVPTLRAPAERDEDAQRAAVRARHDLEQEIRRLEALPQSPGRTRSIKLLRKRLESPPG